LAFWAGVALALSGCKSQKTEPAPQPYTSVAPVAPQLSPAAQRESAKLQAFIDWHRKYADDLLATLPKKQRDCYDKKDGELFGQCTGIYILPNGKDSYKLDWIKAHPNETLATYTSSYALGLDCSGLQRPEIRHFDAAWLKLRWRGQVCGGKRWNYLIQHFTAPTGSTTVMIFSPDYPKYAPDFAQTLVGKN